MRISTFLDMIEPIQQADDGSLPAAGVTDDGDRLARLHGEGDVLQDIPVVNVGEIHLVEFYFSFYLARVVGSRITGDIGIVENPEYPIAGHHPHLQDVELIRHHPQRAKKQVQIKKKGNDLATQLPGLLIRHSQNLDMGCAPPNQQSGADGENDLDHRKEDRISKNSVDIRIAMFAVYLIEFLCLAFLGGKGLDDLDTGDMFLHKSIQRGHRIPYPDKGFVDGFLEQPGSQDQ